MAYRAGTRVLHLALFAAVFSATFMSLIFTAPPSDWSVPFLQIGVFLGGFFFFFFFGVLFFAFSHPPLPPPPHTLPLVVFSGPFSIRGHNIYTLFSEVIKVIFKAFVQYQLSDPYVSTTRTLGLKRFSFVYLFTFCWFPPPPPPPTTPQMFRELNVTAAFAILVLTFLVTLPSVVNLVL